jgi:FKBP-type peptidyl-prolyl cis-trans isomerase FkpA/FKBP-type peptidyl-prolyl cis-trans isomerase FklB
MKPLRNLLVGAGAAAVAALAFETVAADGKALDSQKQKASYGVGMNVGKSFKSDLIDLDVDAFMVGFKDALAGKESALSSAELEKAMAALRDDVTKRTEERAMSNKKASEEFLAKNKTAKDVKTTESGLQYIVEKEGTGASPKATDTVKVHYRGTLIDGTEFDSSYKRNEPAVFPVNGVIKGWTEALQKMKVGSKWKVFIPAEIAYGEQGQPPTIPPASMLIFEIELLGIENSEG